MGTTNNKGENQLHRHARISAVGGHGVGHAGAGSGGVIVLEGGVESKVLNSTNETEKPFELDLDASGGLSDYTTGEPDYDGCANGAAGTIFFREFDTLIVDNKNKITDKFTRMEAPTYHKKLNEAHLVAKRIVLAGKSKGAVVDEHHWVAFDDLRMECGVTLSLDRQRDQFTIQLGRRIDLGADSTLDLTRVNAVVFNSTENNERINLGNVIYRHIVGIHAK